MTEKIAKRGAFAVERLKVQTSDENVEIVADDLGAYVRVSDVKSAIRKMGKGPRLSPETADRIIKSLELE